jgi:hypothetical protein
MKHAKRRLLPTNAPPHSSPHPTGRHNKSWDIYNRFSAPCSNLHSITQVAHSEIKLLYQISWIYHPRFPLLTTLFSFQKNFCRVMLKGGVSFIGTRLGRMILFLKLPDRIQRMNKFRFEINLEIRKPCNIR